MQLPRADRCIVVDILFNGKLRGHIFDFTDHDIGCNLGTPYVQVSAVGVRQTPVARAKFIVIRLSSSANLGSSLSIII